ncbi:DUF2273 domain-containing protein [Pseudokineococcus marinus]|uniref:DUF2273 domain-containing protein n=1 Tax=Pseudokineococcus marinus TaxID=351215 RepID=A0A849BKD8_9ACTN|nr:DUF2273 domain-containing protein [Pseudokineococcus marinus]NNH21763.1 DUF2273 domain-containing protein [Pseudokineococcus marinus]
MSPAVTGLLVGLLLALVAALGGFGYFLLAVVLGAVGWVVGAAVDGKLDLAAVVRGRGRG